MQVGNTDFIYKNKFDKDCSQHDMTYGKSKDLAKRTLLRDKAFRIASDPKYNGYQRGLASLVYKFFDKKSSEVVSLMKQIINWKRSFINQLFENSKKEKFIHFLEKIFGVLI